MSCHRAPVSAGIRTSSNAGTPSRWRQKGRVDGTVRVEASELVALEEDPAVRLSSQERWNGSSNRRFEAFVQCAIGMEARGAYTSGKTAFVQRVTAQAKQHQ